MKLETERRLAAAGFVIGLLGVLMLLAAAVLEFFEIIQDLGFAVSAAGTALSLGGILLGVWYGSRSATAAAVTAVRGDIGNLRGDVRDLRGDMRGLRGDMHGLRGDIGDLRGDVRGLGVVLERIERVLVERLPERS